ncbi:MAG: hypothetical protein JW787_10580 [Sedimentisphaerales bacterium]|nr:hypothetical protein [Sedimentisphaerales bacterium]
MRYIEHIVEPERLLLSWQTSQPGKERGRMFVAEIVRNGDDADIIYLLDSEDFKKAVSLGFEGYPGFTVYQKRYEKILFAFMKRLPPRSRGDFGKYLDSLRIQNDSEISDFALLGYSGAKLPDDDFTVIQTFENANPPFEFLLHVQGYHYYKEQLPFDSIKLEQKAAFQAEPENEFDPNAVKVLIGGINAGHVCRGLTKSFHKWFDLGYKIDASIERKNGTAQLPEIYLYVSIRMKS